jgi:hypothetical protein
MSRFLIGMTRHTIQILVVPGLLIDFVDDALDLGGSALFSKVAPFFCTLL